MKKLLALIMICTLCASFAACAGEEVPEVTTEATTEATEANTEPFDWGQQLNETGSGCAIEDGSSE